MQRNINPAVRVLTLLIVIFGLAGLMAAPTTAQSVPCVEEPLLGTFDSNGDGVLTVEEVRTAAPDNQEIQNVADQMEGAGVSGIQYAGCEEASDDGGDEGGSDNTGSGDGGGQVDETGDDGGDDQGGETDTGDQGAGTVEESGEGDATATVSATIEDDAETDRPNDSDWFDERLTVTTLPAVGNGPLGEAGQPATLVVTSMVGIALLLASASMRLYRIAPPWRGGH